MREQKLTRENSAELITEYPFFRDSMTCEEFDKEQKAYAEHFDHGGTMLNYVPLWKQKQ